MPDADGNIRGISVPRIPWHRDNPTDYPDGRPSWWPKPEPSDQLELEDGQASETP